METVLLIMMTMAVSAICIGNAALVVLLSRLLRESAPAAPQERAAEPAGEKDAEKEKEILKCAESDRAFREMMNYNAYAAYGIEPKEEVV